MTAGTAPSATGMQTNQCGDLLIFSFQCKDGEYLASVLKERLAKYDIDSTQVRVTTDGGLNVISATKNYLKVEHIPCIAHKINNVVTGAIEKTELKPILKKMNKIIKFFKKSDLSTKLEILQLLEIEKTTPESSQTDSQQIEPSVCANGDSKAKEPLKLIQSVTTR